ncbi:hypothetical protein D3C76_1665160 [compost metagenome]
MIVILIVDKPNPFDVEITTNMTPFLVDPKQQFNLDASMKLDAEENYPAFKLTSDANIFSSNIRTRDMRSSTSSLDESNNCLLK